jgi:hypothetical protein
MTRPFDYPDATAAGRGDAPGAGYGDALTTLVDVTAGRPAVLDGGLADAMPRLSLAGDALRDSLAPGRDPALAGDTAGALVTGTVPGAVVPPPVPVVGPPPAPAPAGPVVGAPVPRRQPPARPAQPRRYGAQPAQPRRYGAQPAQPAARPTPAPWPQRPGTVTRAPGGGYDRSGRLPAPGTGWLPGEGPQNLRQLARVLRNAPTGTTPGWQPGGVRWTPPSQPGQVGRAPQQYDPTAARREMVRAARRARSQARQDRPTKRRFPVWLIIVGTFIAINIARSCGDSGRTNDVPMPRPAAPTAIVPDTGSAVAR